jgi:hypothetical protein
MNTATPEFPVIKGDYSFATITDKIADIVLSRWGWRWWAAFVLFLLLTLGFLGSICDA